MLLTLQLLERAEQVAQGGDVYAVADEFGYLALAEGKKMIHVAPKLQLLHLFAAERANQERVVGSWDEVELADVSRKLFRVGILSLQV